MSLQAWIEKRMVKFWQPRRPRALTPRKMIVARRWDVAISGLDGCCIVGEWGGLSKPNFGVRSEYDRALCCEYYHCNYYRSYHVIYLLFGIQPPVTKRDTDGASGLLRGYADSFLSATLSQDLKGEVYKVAVYKFSEALATYMLFNNSICQFQMLLTRAESFSPLSQQIHFVIFVGPLKGEGGVHAAPFHCSSNRDDAIRYVKCLMFVRLRLFILNCRLYLQGYKWSELL